ncbi:carbonic anhydrase family protein [Paenibacillus sp. GSMTC-2017]|uniref:carbonic anhydrase n=1 Tax=Paenibacillus sp. GSMTC-2017 TaxID=2794350 RepID=UPI0018D7354B|nr:carbonic anhydrase family protein [Paenibacillus sp. GSMTC-2017]MBH5316743.1 carbonic anhydrase family protein [Paenibacillus sp. GSMTC-2017]
MRSRLTKTVIGTLFIILSASAVAYAEPSRQAQTYSGNTPHWSYEGDTGPEHWGHISEEYAVCKVGEEQSPINIDTDETNESGNKGKVTVNYKSTAFTFGNNGHTIQANTSSTANQLTLSGTVYNLAQFHFHTPSEHKIDGKASPLELHFVHKSKTGSLAVLGVLIKEGKANTAVTEMWSKLPNKKTDTDLTLKAAIDIKKLLPKDLDAYRYQGSLTTPPCSEGVNWTVFEQSIEMSKAQIKAFQAIFPNNHRPVQPDHNRDISETEVKK